MCPESTNALHDDDLSAIYLSSEDVDLLMREDSPDARVNVLEKIAGSYTSHTFSAREQQFAEEIFRLLMRDTEIKVRHILAERLKDSADIPRDIVLHLAKDVEQVSLPILEASSVLNDADLVKIVETSREMTKLLAISKRPHVSERVSHALVESHYPQVVRSLLGNEGADILLHDYEQILSGFHHEPAITAAMAARGNLPIAVVEKLVHVVSDSLAVQLQQRYQINTEPAGQQAREQVTLELMSHNSSDEDIELTIAQMMTFDRLTPSIILTALCRGYLRFFEIALAKIARIPKANARKLIRDKGALGFRALYQKTKLPESMYEAVNLLLQSVIEMNDAGVPLGSVHYANALVDDMLQRAAGRNIENLPYIMALVRQSATH